MEPLKLHWASSKKNFGDWLSPALCQLLSGRPIQHALPGKCDLIAIGSILDRLGHRWWSRPTTVWGSGFISECRPTSSKHRFCAVRGKFTARLLRNAKIDALGDPGLLCHLLVSEHGTIAKQHEIGIVPHYKDQNDSCVGQFAREFPGAVVLDVFTEPVEFLKRLAECRFVLSSSLHGLIASDAFGIPNAWMQISGAVRGDNFKFRDYYSVFGLTNVQPLGLAAGVSRQQISELTKSYERPGLARVQSELLAAFPFPKPQVARPR